MSYTKTDWKFRLYFLFVVVILGLACYIVCNAPKQNQVTNVVIGHSSVASDSVSTHITSIGETIGGSGYSNPILVKEVDSAAVMMNPCCYLHAEIKKR